MELAARFPLTPVLINLALGLWPKIAPFMIAQALKALVNDDYVNISYKVLNIGAANYLPAYSAEIGVPFDDRGLYVRAVERIVEVAARRARVGEAYHSSPISLRFVRGTDAHMSMMQGHDTMMIELIMATHTQGGEELLGAHENALYKLGGRPHWGQINSLTGSHGLIAEMYPHYGEWQEVHAQLNSSGVFDSPFSKRVGISRARFVGP
jgi:L-gulono-1,4-lactone dehydrogenase